MNRMRQNQGQNKYVAESKNEIWFPEEGKLIKKELKEEEKRKPIDHEKVVNLTLKSRFNKIQRQNKIQQIPALINLFT